MSIKKNKSCANYSSFRTIPPDNMVIIAAQDLEVYELCKKHQNLRRICIQGAFRRYSLEKHFYENVANKNADFCIILESLINIEKREIEKQQQERARKYKPFPFCWIPKNEPEDFDPQEAIIRDIIQQVQN